MEQLRDLAIVLRWVPYEERHRVVTALTENHGKISALARNSIQSRRFGGALEPFAAAEWLFVERRGADLYRVEEAQIRQGFEGIRKDFERMTLGGIFNELMLKIAPERENCPDLFRVHANALAALVEIDLQDQLPLLNAYMAKVLQWSGNQPQLGQCLNCRLPLDRLEPHVAVSCVIADAGWICPSCRDQETRHIRGREGQGFEHSLLRVTPAALQDFMTALTAPIRQVPKMTRASKGEHRALFKFLEALFVFHIPGFDPAAINSFRFLDLGSTLRPQEVHPR